MTISHIETMIFFLSGFVKVTKQCQPSALTLVYTFYPAYLLHVCVHFQRCISPLYANNKQKPQLNAIYRARTPLNQHHQMAG
eukprot:m.201244 g.201244  ORF g.201244 m.201244 type:complete len:82 (-) comp16863_c1_seq1:29-274(-)